MIRLSNTDDLREDLELAVMELQDRFGVAPSSIRRYVNLRDPGEGRRRRYPGDQVPPSALGEAPGAI